MKKIYLIINLFVLTLMTSCALEQVSPSDYNDAIFRLENKLKISFKEIEQSSDPQKQAELVNELQKQTDSSIEELNEIGGFRDDMQLYDAALRLFQFYDRLADKGLNTEPSNINSQLKEWDEEKADEELRFYQAQAKFADNYELYL